MYGKEKDQLEAKIQKMEQNGSDAYTISKQVRESKNGRLVFSAFCSC